ncbi:S8 family serine peptidase [Marimonas arenosa]|uniref:S8 family serine peptidase n=1 Tax=Marimonas arenosa TaxID=1795305 RepID=A0AAE4B511_9RHOB|nr:S8 family serine peptidase [Marimonas arenosa]MDQ2088731.1 S8 family serine peptidase [Marimonas arenosa]
MTSLSPLRIISIAALTLLFASPLLAQEAIQWRGYTINPDGSSDALASDFRAFDRAPAESNYYFVQFTDPITEDAKRRVEAAGAELLTFTRPSTFISRIPPDRVEEVAALEVVAFVNIYQPAFRISTDLALRAAEDRLLPEPEVEIDPVHPAFRVQPDEETARLGLSVQVFQGEDLGQIAEAVQEFGGTVLFSARGDDKPSSLQVAVAPENLPSLAQIDGILWIEDAMEFTLDNDLARPVIGVPGAWSAPENLRGTNQIIAVGDSGLDTGVDNATMHDDVEGRIVSILSQPVRNLFFSCGVPVNVGADDGAAGLNSGHGTHVAGSALGDGTVSGGLYAGVAPEAQLVFQATEQWGDFPGTNCDGYGLYGIPGDLEDFFQEAYDAGARIHTNSWSGSSNPGAYTTREEQLDQFVWDNPDLLILFSAGNRGRDTNGDSIVDADSIGHPAVAKNALTVGASENNRPTILETYSDSYGDVINFDQEADDTTGLAAFSSRGPTDDGRIKPDIVAPGTLVTSIRSSAPPNTFVFEDDMEGGVGGWTATGTWTQSAASAHSGTTSWTDSPAGDHAQGQNITLTSPTIDLSGGTLIPEALRFWMRLDLGDGDVFSFQVSADGGATWSSTIEYTGLQTDWELLKVGLGPFSNSANFVVRFRLLTDNDGDVGDGVWLDDVQVVEGAFLTALTSDFGLSTRGDAIDTAYLMSNGTSMSAPLAAGSAALVREYFTEELGIPYVSAALLRATLLNGAADNAPGQYGVGATQEYAAGPNNATGWGHADVAGSVLPTAPQVFDHVDELAGLNTGDSLSYELDVTDNSVPLSITMVYHDYPGAGIVNQLNLTVTTPSGTTLFPNGGAAVDMNNNVERVRQAVADVELGTYTITVDAPNAPQGPQPFAIATLAGGILVDRDPVDAMLVLDMSGSMGQPACPAGCDTKLQVLQEAVEIFTQLWTAVAVPGDNLGVAYFDSNISEFSVGGDVLLDVLTHSAAIIADVNAQSDRGFTAMGGGVQNAINRLTDPARPRGIVLFTDGMQNRNPMVVNVDDSPPPGAFHLEIADEPGRIDSNVPPTVPPTRLDSGLGITVNTIGIGATPPFVEMLSDIASETDGVSKLTTAPDDDLRRFFVEELVNVLRNGSPQLIRYATGRLRERSQTEDFVVNASSRQVVLKLSWQRGRQLQAEVIKDNKELTADAEVIKGDFYTIYIFDKPRLDGAGIQIEGVWTLSIRGEEGSRYEAAAISEEPELDINASIETKTGTVGLPLLLQARLSQGGRPIKGDAKVTARVHRPPVSIGTLLSKFEMPQQLDIKHEPGATLGQVKLERLLLDREFLEEIRPVVDFVDLRDLGNGSFAAEYPETKVAGAYKIEFLFEGAAESIGKFTRVETLSRALRVGPADARASDLFAEVRGFGRRLNVTLAVTPVDRYGNFMGPDYSDAIRILLDGKPLKGLKDLGNGRYIGETVIPAGSDPAVAVEVANVTLFRGELSDLVRRR